MEKLKIEEVNTGFCRVLYSIKNSSNEKIYYCIQEDYIDSCEFYRCSQGPYFEPMYSVKFKEGATLEIEIPKGKSQLEKSVINYISASDNLIGVV